MQTSSSPSGGGLRWGWVLLGVLRGEQLFLDLEWIRSPFPGHLAWVIELPMSNAHSTSPAAMFGSLIQHRGLVWDLVKRDFIGRYKGSIMGVAWSLFNPLLLLAIYTIVF